MWEEGALAVLSMNNSKEIFSWFYITSGISRVRFLVLFHWLGILLKLICGEIRYVSVTRIFIEILVVFPLWISSYY